jgi:hypothetical protein
VAQLCLRAADAVEWLTANLDRFSPVSDGRLSKSGLQAVAELAILYSHLASCASPATLPLRGSLPVWRAFLVERCEANFYAERVRRDPLRAYYLALPYLMLRAGGYRSPQYEDALRQMRRWGLPEATEVVPYRRLDRRYFLWRSGWARQEPNWLRLYRDTGLFRWRGSTYVDEEGAYAITHTLFYLTDFGRRPLPLSEAAAERIVALVESLLVHYWRLSHWDLVGELLMNLECLDRRGSVFYAGAARAFLRAWRRDGSVPPSPAAIMDLRSAAPSERPSLAFRSCYHTTLVGVLYASTALARPPAASHAAATA